MRLASKAAPAAVLLILSACGESEAPSPAVKGKEEAGAATAPAWSFRSTDNGGQAHWGPMEGDSAFWVGCDPAAKTVVLRRAGGSGSELNLRAGAAEGRYPATTEGGVAVARVSVADPALNSLAAATGPLTVTAGEALTTGPMTGAFGRVIRACRRLADEPAAAAVAAGAPGERVVVHDCVDGNSVTARYPDDVTVQVTQGSKTYRMIQAPASTGTRYVGEGRQWWVQGRGRAAAGRLTELPEGQTTTTDLGLLCKVRTGVG